MTTEFTPIASLVGGGLIGLSAVWLMLSLGRIAGISGIVVQVLPPDGEGARASLVFIAGLMLAVPVYALLTGGLPAQSVSTNVPMLVVAGLLVGFGSVYGRGCTSGHGVCGISRLSQRSIIATLNFMAIAIITTFVLRHGLGG